MIDSLKNILDDFDSDFTVKRTQYLWSAAIPKPKQSVQFGRYGAFTSKEKREYVDNLVKDLYNTSGNKFEDTVRITIVYCFPFLVKEAEWSFKKTRPDLDNLTKPVLDALANKWLIDDAQVAVLQVKKIKYKFPCIIIKIDEIIENRLIKR